MSTEYNLCPKCGGVLSLKRPDVNMRVHTSAFQACTCPKPNVTVTMEQDITYGDLGDHAAAFHDESWGYDQIAIRAKGEVRIGLRPRQFLRLLDWGAKHRAAIERLTKEQGRGK